MIRNFLYFLVFMPFCLFSISTKFTVFTFSDFSALQENEKNFSYIYHALQKEKSNAKHFLTVLNGDFIASQQRGLSKRKNIIDTLNHMSVDIAVFGKHELDIGIDELHDMVSESKFNWLASNVMDASSNTFCKNDQALIYHCDGINIGIFGLVDFEKHVFSENNELLLLPYVDMAKQKCIELKEKGADVIIAITHMSLAEDRILAKEVKNIDVILASHDSQPFVWYEDDMLVYKTGVDKDVLNRIDLIIEKTQDLNKEKISVYPIWKVIDSKEE